MGFKCSWETSCNIPRSTPVAVTSACSISEGHGVMPKLVQAHKSFQIGFAVCLVTHQVLGYTAQASCLGN